MHGLDGKHARDAVNSSGCSVGREGDRRKARDGEGRHGPSELAPASHPARNREGRRGKGAGDVAHHDSELRGCVADEVRRRNGGSASSPSSAAPKAARARVWGKGRLR